MTASELLVRPAHPSQAAQIAWLAALTFPLACPPGTPATTMAAHVADHLSPRDVARWISGTTSELLVATAGDDVVGYALMNSGTPSGPDETAALADAVGPGPYLELSKIYVHPRRHGDGTAGALMAACLETAARPGPETALWLGTNRENGRAQAFYRRHGFVVVGGRSYDVGGVPHDDVVMLHTP